MNEEKWFMLTMVAPVVFMFGVLVGGFYERNPSDATISCESWCTSRGPALHGEVVKGACYCVTHQLRRDWKAPE